MRLLVIIAFLLIRLVVSAQKIEVSSLNGHNVTISSICISSDNKYFASSSLDGMVILWDMQNQSEIKEFDNLSNTVTSIKFSHNTKYLAVAADNLIKILSVPGGQIINVLKGHNATVTSIDFSIDDAYILSGSLDKTARVWDINSGLPLKSVSHSKKITCVGFSHDNNYFATGSDDKSVKIWFLNSGLLYKELRRYSSPIWSLAFSNDSKYLISTCGDENKFANETYLWNVQDGRLLRTYSGQKDVVNTCAFSSDSRYVFSGSWDKTICIWSLNSDIPIHTIVTESPVTSIALSPTDHFLISGENNNLIKIWQNPLQNLKDTIH